MTFRTNIVTDDFNRAGPAIGANWIAGWFGSPLPIIVDSDSVTQPDGSGPSTYVSAEHVTQVAGDRYVETTIKLFNKIVTPMNTGLYLCIDSATDNSGYIVYFSQGNTIVRLQLNKRDETEDQVPLDDPGNAKSGSAWWALKTDFFGENRGWEVGDRIGIELIDDLFQTYWIPNGSNDRVYRTYNGHRLLFGRDSQWLTRTGVGFTVQTWREAGAPTVPLIKINQFDTGSVTEEMQHKSAKVQHNHVSRLHKSAQSRHNTSTYRHQS